MRSAPWDRPARAGQVYLGVEEREKQYILPCSSGIRKIKQRASCFEIAVLRPFKGKSKKFS